MTSLVSMACGKQRRAAAAWRRALLHVDDLAAFINHPIQGAPAVTNLQVRFVHAPPTADRCVVYTGCGKEAGLNVRTQS